MTSSAYERGVEAAKAYHDKVDLLGHILPAEPVPPYRPGGRNYTEWVEGFLNETQDTAQQ